MITHWKQICKETSQDLIQEIKDKGLAKGLTIEEIENQIKAAKVSEQDVIKEIETYTAVLKKGIRNLEKIDYGLYGIAKLVPKGSKLDNAVKALEILLERTPDKQSLKDRHAQLSAFLERWREVYHTGRWKIKGQYNRFKQNK